MSEFDSKEIITGSELNPYSKAVQDFTAHLQQLPESAFMKNDAGKNMLSLIEPQFILLLGEVLTFGAKKYAPNNWQKCEDTSRYKDALLRHIYAYLGGEQLDPESGLPHLGHAAFGLMCLNYFDNLTQQGTKHE